MLFRSLLGDQRAILESFFDTLHTRGVRVYSSDQAVAMANAMADLFHALGGLADEASTEGEPSLAER